MSLLDTQEQVCTPMLSADKKLPWRQRSWSVGTLCYSASALAVLFFWLLWGDFTQNMKDRAIYPIAQVMLRDFTAPDWYVGLMVGSIPSAIGLLIIPIVSIKSDRYRSRLGRRIPFILATMPINVLMMFGLAATSELGSQLHHSLITVSENTCRIAVFTFFWSFLEIATIVCLSLMNALVNDVVPHAVIGRFLGLFRAVSLGAAVLFNYFLMGHCQTHYRIMFYGLGLLQGIGTLLMCLFVKEGGYPPPPAVKAQQRSLRPMVQYIKECYGNRFFIWFFITSTLAGLALAPVNTFSIYHGRSVGLSDELYGKCMALSYCFSLLLAYPLGVLADRFHPLRLGLACMAAYAAVTAYGFCFAFTAKSFFVALLLHTITAGCYYSGGASLAQRLLPREKFAEISSAGGIIGAVCYTLLPPTLGIVIEWLHRDYRYVFLFGSLLAFAAAVAHFVLLQKFKALGGDKAYVPPI